MFEFLYIAGYMKINGIRISLTSKIMKMVHTFYFAKPRNLKIVHSLNFNKLAVLEKCPRVNFRKPQDNLEILQRFFIEMFHEIYFLIFI